MIQLLKMAWRNLGRHRGRTILSLLAVTCGVMIIILFKGMVDGMLDSTINYSINLNSGHVRIIRPEYAVKERLLSLTYPVGENGRSYSGLIRDIRRLPGVKTSFGRIRFGMMLVVGEEHELVLGNGTDLAAEDNINHLRRYLQGKGAGRLPLPGKQEIMLGSVLMKKLGLQVGDKVNAVFTSSFGSFRIATFKITGKMVSGLNTLEEGLVYLPLDQAMNLLEMDDMVTEIVVFGANPGLTKRLKSELQKYLTDEKETLKVIPWDEYNELMIIYAKFRFIYDLFYIFFLILASFVVFNTLLMVVSERTREIGMLSALGMTPRNIKYLFVSEGAMIAVLGSFTGTVIGGMVNYFISVKGIDMSAMMGLIPRELPMLPTLYFSYRMPVLLYSFAMGIVVTILAAYLPARRASLLNPTEALRTN